MLKKIVIYDGEGVSTPLNVVLKELLPKAHLLSEKEILEGDWDLNSSLLIIPGGRDRPYHKVLASPGNQKIRSFVENGGSFLGICAGAYYASAFVDFERGHKNEILEARELSFFPGAAVGPAYELGVYDYESDRGARTALIRMDNRIWPVYFNGGPTFIGDFSNVKILATYDDIEGKPPAILLCKIGKGTVIVSGVHIEKNPELFQRILTLFIRQKPA